MSELESFPLDPNQADAQELIRLPGVGPTLAERIIAARPFTGLEDLQRVPGLGAATLERIGPHLTFEAPAAGEGLPGRLEPQSKPTAEEVTPEVSEPPGLSAELEGLAKRSGEASRVAPTPPRAPEARPIREPMRYSRGETLWLAAGTGILSVIFSVILTLAILGGINGTLDVGRHEALRQLRNETSALQTDLDGIASRFDSLRARLDALEGVSGRMATVEELVSELQGEVDGALESVASMRTAVDDLEESTNALDEQVGRFEAFLGGLRGLLEDLTTEPAPAEP